MTMTFLVILLEQVQRPSVNEAALNNRLNFRVRPFLLDMSNKPREGLSGGVNVLVVITIKFVENSGWRLDNDVGHVKQIRMVAEKVASS